MCVEGLTPARVHLALLPCAQAEGPEQREQHSYVLRRTCVRFVNVPGA